MIAVIGPSEASPEVLETARKVGELLALRGAIVVCGGLGGIMEAVSEGANAARGTVIGILPGRSRTHANAFVTYAIATNLGEARNAVIAQTADAVIAVGESEGTLSEIGLSLKSGKPVVLLSCWDRLAGFSGNLHRAATPEQAVQIALALGKGSHG